MGLDITAWEKVTPTDERFPVKENGCPEGWPEDEDLIVAFAYVGFERSLEGLEAGVCYRPSGEHMHFSAGSYSGYGNWRRRLSMAAFGIQSKSVWDDPDSYANRPFFELINFADNEGTIGPIACARLAEHFEAGRDTVRARLYDKVDGWDQQKYDEWARAFDLAANTGLVRFH